MELFKILEHTGDAKIQAFGKTKEELFLNAMKAMAAILQPRVKKLKSQKVRKIKIKSNDLNALTVDFLNEVNYLVQTHKEIYDDMKFKKFSEIELEAELLGKEVEKFGEEIKAVTYHGVDIKKSAKGGLEAIILFDI